MSRAKPIAERNALDFYATPDALALAICRHLGARYPHPRRIIEPSAGLGPFIRAARIVWPGTPVHAVDVDQGKADALLGLADSVVCADWAQYVRGFRLQAREIVLGNPPFRDAESHCLNTLESMDSGAVLAFLLRLNFLGSRGRLAFWRRYPLTEVVPLVPRPSFTGGSTDATEYGLFLWENGYQGPTTLAPPLDWTGAA